MFLKRIELFGFKSFADKTELEFGPGITAIVGPNGSGKSNVADAVRWVMGEHSAKQLRGDRMEDVIFAGSQARKPLGMAEVSLTFDNSDGALRVEFSEVTVTRKVYRDGKSEFYINKGPCRLRDIQEMFLDTGIGKDSYSVIEHAKIDDILYGRSEDRRAMLEETAGIAKYKAKKREALRKLERTERELERVRDILEEISGRLGPLEEQARRAELYKSYRQSLQSEEVALNRFLFQRAEERGAALRQSMEALRARIAEAEAVIKDREGQLEAAGREERALLTELDRLRDEISRLEKESERKRGRRQVLDEKRASLGRRCEEITADINRCVAALGDLEAEIEAANKVVEMLDEQLQAERAQAAAAEARLEELVEGEEALRRRLDERKGDLIEVLRTSAELKNRINSLEREERSLRASLEKTELEIAACEQSLEEHKSLLLEERKRRDSLAEQIEHLQGSREDLLSQAKRARAELEQAERELGELRRREEQVSSRLQALRGMEEAYEGYSRASREVLMAARRELLRGVRGSVAELIHVPEGLETAITVALGAAAQHIVCEREADAARAIEHLKRSSAGRTTFLPLDGLVPRPLAGQTKERALAAGALGLASEMVSTSEGTDVVVDFLLGRTLVAEDLETARRVSRAIGKRYKVVTVQGDVVHVGGPITGGSARAAGGGLLQRRKTMERLARESTELVELLRQAEVKAEGAARRVESMEGRAREIREEIFQKELALRTCSERIQGVERRLEQLEERRRMLAEDAQSLSDEIERCRSQCAEHREALTDLQTEDEVKRAISMEEQELTRQTARRAQLEREVTEAKVRVARTEEEMAARREALERLEGERSRLHEAKRRLEEQLEDARRSMEGLAEEESSLVNTVEELEAKGAELSGALRRLEEERVSCSEGQMKLQAEIRNKRRALSRWQRELQEAAVELTRVEMELERIEERMLADYGCDIRAVGDTEDLDVEAARERIEGLKDKLRNLGPVNLAAIEEYREVRERYEFLQRQKLDLEGAKASLFKIIDEMERRMKRRFKEAFARVREEFQKVFSELFEGGRADLVLVDEENFLESGVDIVAQPPGKKLQSLSLLSGGERALTAIAFIFSLLRVRPRPFCVLDEVEAALDEVNVNRFRKFLKEHSRQTQFIVITHQKATMEAADALYGITMEGSGVSKLVSVRFTEGKAG